MRGDVEAEAHRVRHDGDERADAQANAKDPPRPHPLCHCIDDALDEREFVHTEQGNRGRGDEVGLSYLRALRCFFMGTGRLILR